MDTDFLEEVKQLNRARQIQKDVLKLKRKVCKNKVKDLQTKSIVLQKLEGYKKEFDSIELKTKEIQNAENELDNTMHLVQNKNVISETDA